MYLQKEQGKRYIQFTTTPVTFILVHIQHAEHTMIHSTLMSPATEAFRLSMLNMLSTPSEEEKHINAI